MSKSMVSREVAQHVLFVILGDDNVGIQPGGWETDLIRLIQHADADNRVRLAGLFPEHVVAVEGARESWGLDWLRRVVRRDVFGAGAVTVEATEQGLDLLGAALAADGGVR
jgi:hypothetical protein